MSGIHLVILGANGSSGQSYYIGSNGVSGSAQRTFSTTSDANGNFYIGGNELAGGTGYSNVLVKASATGTTQWARNFRNSGYVGSTANTARALGVDPADGSLYVLWTNSTLSGQRAPTVTKYNSTGTAQWSSSPLVGAGGPTTTGSVYVQNIQFDSSNLYFSASVPGSSSHTIVATIQINKSTGALVTGSSLSYRYFANLTSSGYGLVVSGTTAYATMGYSNKTALVVHNLSTNTISNVCVIGTSSYSIYPRSIAVDSSSNRYLFGTGTAANNTVYGYVIKIDSSNAIQWAKCTTNTAVYSTTAPNTVNTVVLTV